MRNAKSTREGQGLPVTRRDDGSWGQGLPMMAEDRSKTYNDSQQQGGIMMARWLYTKKDRLRLADHLLHKPKMILTNGILSNDTHAILSTAANVPP